MSLKNSEKWLHKLQKMCAKKEYCATDMLIKLSNALLSEAQKHSIIEQLKAQKFIDHQRYANAFCNDAVNLKRWGKLKIRAKLTAKKIEPHCIQNALDQINRAIYSERLQALSQEKKKHLTPYTQKNKAKLMRFLSQRGFLYDEFKDLI